MILVAPVSENEEKNPEIITVSVWASISGLGVPRTTSAQQWGRFAVALFPGGICFLQLSWWSECYLGCVRVANFGWIWCMWLGAALWRGQWRVRAVFISYERFFLVSAAEWQLPVQSEDFCMMDWSFLIRTGRLMKKRYWKSPLEIFYYTELRISLWRGIVLGQEVDLVVSYFLSIFLELMMSKVNLIKPCLVGPSRRRRKTGGISGKMFEWLCGNRRQKWQQKTMFIIIS